MDAENDAEMGEGGGGGYSMFLATSHAGLAGEGRQEGI